MNRWRILGIRLLALGLAVSLYGFALVGAASLPYQDPPPELLVKQAREIRQAKLVFGGGIATLVAGMGVLRFGRSAKRANSR